MFLDHGAGRAVALRAGASFVTGAACLALSMPVVAQDQDAGSTPVDPQQAAKAEQSDGVIIVTAQFRGQSLQSTPLAITAVTGEMLDARGQRSVIDLAATAPNVTLESGGGQRGTGLIAYIRGIGQYNSSPAFEPGVGTYIDDVYIATLQSSMLGLFDLERVEILRGPQGTLAGKNSVGGAIKLFTKRPRGDGSGYVRANYGSFDHISASAAADFALTENLFAGVNIAAQNENGYVRRFDYACLNPGSGLPLGSPDDDCQAGTEGGVGFVAGRLALRWLPTDRVEINIAGDVTDEDSDPKPLLVDVVVPANLPPTSLNGVVYGTQFATAGTYVSYDTFCNVGAPGGVSCVDPRSETDVWGISGTVDVELSDIVSAKSITAYRAHRSYNAVDGDGSPLTINNFQNGYRGHQFSQELRVQAQPMEALDLTAGVYYLKTFINADQRVDIQYQNNLFFSDDETRATSKAIYGQVVFNPIDRLTLIGGMRYTKEFKSFTFYRTRPDGNNTPVPGLFGLNNMFRGDSFDYRLNASFDITDDVMIYGQYATAFKGGGVNAQPFFPNQVLPFGPETIGTFEAGFKSTLWDGRLTLNAAAFRSAFKDIQLQPQFCPPPATPFPCAAPQNVGSAHITGAEVELHAEPVDGLDIDVTGAYLDFDYFELIGVPTISDSMVAPFTSKWNGSLGVQYRAGLASGGSIVPRLDLTYRSAIFTDPSNAPTNRIAGRTIANARISYLSPGEDWEFSLRVSNLFDKYYLENLIDNNRFTGIAYSTPAPPRRWLASVRHNF